MGNKPRFKAWCIDCGESMVENKEYPKSLYCKKCKLKADIVYTDITPEERCKECGHAK